MICQSNLLGGVSSLFCPVDSLSPGLSILYVLYHDDSEQNPMVGAPRLPLIITIITPSWFSKLMCFSTTHQENYLLLGWWMTPKHNSERYYDAGSWQIHNFPLEHKHNLFLMFCMLACTDFILKRTYSFQVLLDIKREFWFGKSPC